MRDPFDELLAMHRAAEGFGSGLAPRLLSAIEQKCRQQAHIRSQPNVVSLGIASSQSGPAQRASEGRMATEDGVITFRRRRD